MELAELSKRALEVREKYAAMERGKNGKEWTRSQIAEGFVGDVGDLMKLVMAKEGLREIADVDRKFEHEISDCLWSVLVLAEKYNVDLEKAFLQTMDELTKRFEP